MFSLMKKGMVEVKSKEKKGEVSSLKLSKSNREATIEEAESLLKKFNSKARKYDLGKRNQFREVEVSRRKAWLDKLRQTIERGQQDYADERQIDEALLSNNEQDNSGRKNKSINIFQGTFNNDDFKDFDY